MLVKEKRVDLAVSGMTCVSCERRIESTVSAISGVKKVNANFSTSKVEVVFDESIVQLEAIIKGIHDEDYTVLNPLKLETHNQEKRKEKKSTGTKTLPEQGYKVTTIMALIIVFFISYLIINRTLGFSFIPEVEVGMSYGVLFVVGLLTSLHCVAMCGGINLSQCVKYQVSENDQRSWNKFKPSFLYNAGRVTSYTLIGGLVGGLGSIVSFSGGTKGLIAIMAGGFMIVMGLNMLNIFPSLRKLTPRIPRSLSRILRLKTEESGPYLVGLANGLMPCGPLQAMQLYALGTGSFIVGALSMFFFSLGTVPLMFGFGAMSTYLTKRFKKDMLFVSSLLVVLLGVIMAGRGFSLSGLSLAGLGIPKLANTVDAYADNIAVIENGIQYVTTNLSTKNYTPIVVQKGIPVRWNFSVAQGNLNGCNTTFVVPKYNIEHTLVVGDNIIEFTPTESGSIVYTCWMGMITSNITIVDDLSNTVRQSERAVQAGQAIQAGQGTDTTAKVISAPYLGEIYQAVSVNNEQIIEVKVEPNGYTPSAIIVQKGMNTKIKFSVGELNPCNTFVVFPTYQGELDLRVEQERETPWFVPESDFSFQCSMNMLRGFVIVVEDINVVDLQAIRTKLGNVMTSASIVCEADCCE